MVRNKTDESSESNKNELDNSSPKNIVINENNHIKNFSIIGEQLQQRPFESEHYVRNQNNKTKKHTSKSNNLLSKDK